MLPIGRTSDEVKCEDLVKITIGDDLEKFFQVGSQLPQQEREELVEFLKWNIDVFAWNTYEAPGVDPEFICHHLNVNPLITPKKQLPRRPSKEHAEVVRQEVTKLKQARGYQGDFLSRMVGKHGSGQEKEWEVASVCWFHRFE